ncbi:hypothetical protein C8Q79DRAFT_572296 [Trametes meyenii]|nr:hypothetical protein C8Q79DRAFT_572296 [Trametes meyenii]
MNPQEGFDPYKGWSQDSNGNWYPSSYPTQSHAENVEETASQHPSANRLDDRQPGPTQPPLPRPAYRGAQARSAGLSDARQHPGYSATSQTPGVFAFEPVGRPPLISSPFPTPPSSHQPPTTPFHSHPPGHFGDTDTPSAGPSAPPPEHTNYVPAWDFDSRGSTPEMGSPVPRPQKASAHSEPPPTAVRKVDKGKRRADPEPAPKPTSKKAKTVAKPSAKAQGKRPAQTATSHTGRQPGASNYSEEDVDTLLDLVQNELPVGQRAWERITEQFNEWAQDNGRPPRSQKPLKSKFSSLVSTPKPTGSATVPANVKRAKKLENQINEKVHLGVIDDAEMADTADVEESGVVEVNEDTDDSDVEVLDTPASSNPASRKAGKQASATPQPVLKGFRDQGASSAARSSGSTRRAAAQDFMGAVAAHLDPAARERRDESRFVRRAAQEENQRLAQENRDLRARNDVLMDRLQQQTAELTRLQARLELNELMQATVGQSRSRYHHWHQDSVHRRSRSPPSHFPFNSYSYRSHSPTPHHYARSPPPRSYYRSPPPHSFTRSQPVRGPSPSSIWRSQQSPSPGPSNRSPQTGYASDSAGLSSAVGTATPSFTQVSFSSTSTSTAGLDTLAAAAASGPHSPLPCLPDGAASVTLTFTPSRRARRHDQSGSPSDYHH